MAEYIVDLYTDHDGARCEPVVRCRDCANAAPYGDGIECRGPLVQTWEYYNDEPLHNPVRPDGFCAWGRRREGDR